MKIKVMMAGSIYTVKLSDMSEIGSMDIEMTLCVCVCERERERESEDGCYLFSRSSGWFSMIETRSPSMYSWSLAL